MNIYSNFLLLVFSSNFYFSILCNILIFLYYLVYNKNGGCQLIKLVCGAVGCVCLYVERNVCGAVGCVCLYVERNVCGAVGCVCPYVERNVCKSLLHLFCLLQEHCANSDILRTASQIRKNT